MSTNYDEEEVLSLTKEQKQARNKRLLGYAFRAKKPLLLGLLLTGLAVALDLAGPYTIGRIVDQELAEGRGPENWYILAGLLAFYFFCMLGAASLRAFAAMNLHTAANRIAQFIQQDVFSHVHELPIAYFDSLPAGKVVSRVTNDTAAVKNLFVVVLSQLATAAVYALGIFLSLALLDLSLLLISLLTVPFLLIILLDFRKKSAKFNRRYRKNLSNLNGSLNENIQGMEVIQALGQEERIDREFNEINDSVYKNALEMTKLYSYSAYNATSTLQYLMMGAVLLYFGIGSLSSSYFVPIGNLYIFIDYMTKLFNQVNNAMQRVGDLERSLSAADHIFELLALTPDDPGTVPAGHLEGSVRFEQVNFAYTDEPVLRDVGFQVKAGETIAFVGQTGSGKTTIMNLLLGFYKPQGGEIWLDDKPLSKIKKKEAREQMAIVQQEPYLFTGTILSNITLGREKITRLRAIDALREVGGEDFLARLPQGIDTPVQEKGNEFSTGERQLISFARALAQDPKILVLDEATASIDSETESIIQKGIERLAEGRTTFMIAHRLSTIRHANQILVLDHGLVVEDGNHDQLIAQNGLYKKMYHSQSHVEAHS